MDDRVMAATSLTLDTPAQTTPGAPVVLTGTYSGSPVALDYDFGAGWVQASSVAFADGTYSVTVPAGVALGTYAPEIRDHDAPSVTALATGFVVSDWTPAALQTSPGAQALFEFNASNPADTTTTSDLDVSRVVNALNPAQSLTAIRATGGNAVTVANNSGADGTSRLLRFHATTISSNSYDPSTNWLDAGGVGGTAGSALVDLANSADLKTSGSFTTVIALYVDTSMPYEAGPIWGSLAAPGPLQYVQLRINKASLTQGANLADSGGASTNAQGAITAGWHVMTMIKDGGQLTYRLDGKTVATTAIASTASFTASDFMIGGGFPQGAGANLGQENGVPAPYVGEFQAYSGALQGTDLTNAEALAGGSIGVLLPSGNIAARTIWLPDRPTVYAAAGGDTVNAGAGAATVTAATGSVLAKGGSGPLWFVGGSGSSTVAGASGAVTASGGSGGGVFDGGAAGGNVLVAAGGNTTLTAAAAGDRLFGSGTGTTVMVAGSGGESLVGGNGTTIMTGGVTTGAVLFTDGMTTANGGASGGDTIVGGLGGLLVNAQRGDAVFGGRGALQVKGSSGGADTISGGSGSLVVDGNGANMFVVAASSSSTIDTGAGASLIFSGSGATTVTGGAGTMQAVIGSGKASFTEGAGATVYDVVKGSAGGTILVDGFRPGADRIDLFGYQPSDLQVSTASGSTVLSLHDGTRITLAGVSDPGSSIVS
jgi:hypothetical protein